MMITLKNLKKKFGETLAVDDISLEVKKGEILGLLGPNGAGKTTTISMLVGFLSMDSGSVDIAGQGSPEKPEIRRKIGIVPQTLAIYTELSGQENLEFFAKMHGFKDEVLKERIDWALNFVNLSDRRGELARKYSGGMKRRLNMAAALLHQPELLILDEPTVGVDPQSRNAIFENVEQLRENGCTILFTTHYMEEAQRLCDRVAIMDKGKLLALDTVDNLIAEHGGKSIITAETSSGTVTIETDDPLQEIVKMKEMDKLSSFQMESPNLETVFLNITGRHLRD